MGACHSVVTGTLPRDAEQKQLQSGTHVVRFSVAYDVGWGEKKKTMWVNCSMFGDRGSKVLPYLQKGTMVNVSTRSLHVNEYKKQDGSAAWNMQCDVDNIDLLSRPPQSVAPQGEASADDIGF